ncbi:hypothetical protein MRX96_030056 [Rhipicephalus microplus]
MLRIVALSRPGCYLGQTGSVAVAGPPRFAPLLGPADLATISCRSLGACNPRGDEKSSFPSEHCYRGRAGDTAGASGRVSRSLQTC